MIAVVLTEARTPNLLNTMHSSSTSGECPSPFLILGLPTWRNYSVRDTGIDNDNNCDLLVDLPTLAAAAVPGRQCTERWVKQREAGGLFHVGQTSRAEPECTSVGTVFPRRGRLQ